MRKRLVVAGAFLTAVIVTVLTAPIASALPGMTYD